MRGAEFWRDVGLLGLRVFPGFLLASSHGWGKLIGFSEYLLKFPDPIGVGVTASLVLAIFAEFFCSIGVMVGLLTRFAAIPVVITLLVAALVVHADDPFQKKEFALVYAIPFLVLIFTGPGRFSIDRLMGRN